VLQSLGRQLTSGRAQALQDQAAAQAGPAAQHPPTPLSGYRVAEVTITPDSPAAGHTLSDIIWPPDTTLVSVLHDRRLGPPDPHTALSPGDRVSLLVPPSHPAPPEQIAATSTSPRK
jgi:Trk K+ transport system NAD-binding subunit